MRINITVPVLNEENKLEASISRVVRFVEEHLTTHRFEIVIADNDSTRSPICGSANVAAGGRCPRYGWPRMPTS